MLFGGFVFHRNYVYRYIRWRQFAALQKDCTKSAVASFTIIFVVKITAAAAAVADAFTTRPTRRWNLERSF